MLPGSRARLAGGTGFDVTMHHACKVVSESVRRYHPAINGRVHLGTTSSSDDLVGRTNECRSLEELLAAVRDGQSRVVVLRGDAGIGKTALLEHLIHAASGFRVERAIGIESEMEMPFAALHQLCAPMLDRLDALPEPQR
jgi:predicted ATPase